MTLWDKLHLLSAKWRRRGCMGRPVMEKEVPADLLTDEPGILDTPRSLAPEFRRFPKIHRLNRDIIITEKIDGTNAQVYVDPDGQVFAGSRNRWLTLTDDNYGFAAWVKGHEKELKRLGPGRHYGEWWGKGINRNYGLYHRRFSLFNVSRWYDQDMWDPFTGWFDGQEERQPCPDCCHVVPILYAGPWDDPDSRTDWDEPTQSVERICEKMWRSGSVVAPGFKDPEGIVIFHQPSNHLFKVTLKHDGEPKSVLRARSLAGK